MSVVACREAGPGLDAALDALLPLEPNLSYANFAPIARRDGAAARLHRGRFREDAAGLGAFVAREGGGRPLAALRLGERVFESAHFDMPMARIEAPVAVPEDGSRAAALRALYQEAFAALRQAGFVHVAARASTRDRVTPWVLQELGAFHVDTQVSWMIALTGTPHDDPVPPPLRFEVRDGAALRALPPAAWKRLAEWGGQAFDRGPLVFDHGLPQARARRVYEVWTDRVMRGEWAEAVLLAWQGEEIVAFISMRRLDDVSEAAGVQVCGRGLGATLPEHRGLFTALQREMVAARPLGTDFMENETQVATLGSINVYARLGGRYLRSTSTFHLRLDAARPTCG